MGAQTPVLPAADWQTPSCGACGSDTEYDDAFVCHSCGLQFDREDLSASYLDDEIEACGAACDNWWHGDDLIRPGRQYECGTCALPTGHTSDHWTNCQIAREAVR